MKQGPAPRNPLPCVRGSDPGNANKSTSEPRPQGSGFRGHGLALVMLLVGPALAEKVPTDPNPKLSPADVVSAQLQALKHNDDPEPDAGIRTTFRFASPSNRSHTGPVERFIRMVKSEEYAAMLNYQSDLRSEVMVQQGAARQKVTLIDSAGKQATYVFILSKQAGPPCSGCWMTDSVFRVDNPVKGFEVADAPTVDAD